MILWGVKSPDGEMQIVSTMAAAYLSFRHSPESEIFKLDMAESGEYSVIDGPLEVVKKDGSLYGTKSIKPYVILHILFSLIMGAGAIQTVLGGSWLSVVTVWLAWFAVHKISNVEERIQRDTLGKYREFAEDMRNLLGS